MSEDNFQTRLDGIDAGDSTVLDICKKYNEQELSPVITDEQLTEHPFFKKYFAAELCKILSDWCSEGTLTDEQRESFQVCSQFLLKLMKTVPKAKQWLASQAQLIELTSKCLNEIASYGYYIAVDGVEDPNLESFDCLIQAFENADCRQVQLLDLIVKIVTSSFYIDTLYSINDTNISSLNITQRFLLITCPDYILQCDDENNFALQIANKMLFNYDEVFNHLLPRIKEWTKALILALTYPLEFILAVIRKLTFEQRKHIFPVVLNILLNKSTADSDIEEVRPLLIYKLLCLLIEIMRSDKDLANQLKNKTDNKSDLIQILNNLSKNDENDKIRFKAVALLSLLVPEEEFFKEHKTEDVTGLFLKNFDKALHQEKPKEIEDVLRGIKDLIQNDDIKQEIVKQNGLASLLKYAKETEDDPLGLEMVYAMTFNIDAKNFISEDKEFVDCMKLLQSSETKKIAKMAHGIIWKLENEENFQKKEGTEKPKSSEESSEKPTTYDMMISYCWAQKELCHKINDRLEKDGYQVWLDRDEMHGSIIESMANAIEQSRFVIICMSSNYKNSINCKAEAEYAFNRKSKIIPLIVEPAYKADGWLGFLAGSKIYVDFADKDDEEFDKAYELLIAELERNGLHESDEEKPTTTSPSPTTDTKSEPEKESEKKSEPEKESEKKSEPEKESEKKSEPEKESEPEKTPEEPPILTTEYLNVGVTPLWTNVHVNEFLADNQLEELKPICETMDGETLLQFYETCAAIPDKMYALVNNPKGETSVSMGTFFKFLAKLKKFLPPKPPRIIQFQYNYVYPQQTKSMN